MFLLVLSMLCGWTIQVLDTTGRPVDGAAIIADGELLGHADSCGIFSSDARSTPARVEVLAPGYGAGWLAPGDSTVLLEPRRDGWGTVVTVSAARPGLRDLLPSTAVVSGKALESASLDGFATLSATTPGFHAREYGGALPVTSVSTRGAEPGHTVFSVAGHRFDTARDGLPGALIEPALFGAMEIGRGGASGLRNGGLAGAVNLVPGSHLNPPSALVSLDSRGASMALARFSLGPGRMASCLRRLRGRSDGRGWSSSVLLSLDGGAASDCGLLLSAAEGDIEEPDWAVPSDATRRQSSADAWASRWAGPFRISGGFHVAGLEYDTDGKEGPEPPDAHGDGSADVSIEARLDGPGFLDQIIPGVGLRSEWMSSSVLGARARETADLSLRQSAGFGRLAVASTLRLEVCGHSASQWGAMVGIGLCILEEGRLELGLNASRSFRRPTFNDLYWPADQFAEGNPSLQPETGLEAELALSTRPLDGVELHGSAFIADITDMMIWLPQQGGAWSPDNVGTVRRKGIESGVSLELDPVRLDATLTLCRSEDRTPGSVSFGCLLPYRPELIYGSNLLIDLPAGLSLEAGLRGAGWRFTNRVQTSGLPPYSLTSAGIGFPILPSYGISGSVSITNLFDEAYEEASGYPGRSRSARVSISWEGR